MSDAVRGFRLPDRAVGLRGLSVPGTGARAREHSWRNVDLSTALARYNWRIRL